MDPRNSRILLLALIVVAVAAVLVFSPQVAQAILGELRSLALLCFIAFVFLR